MTIVVSTPIGLLLPRLVVHTLGLSTLGAMAIAGCAFGVGVFAAHVVRASWWKHDLWLGFGIAGLVSGQQLWDAEYGGALGILITGGFALGALAVLLVLSHLVRRPTP